MRVTFLRLCLLAAPVLLSGCGEGWEAQRTTEILPYGNSRTAGSGVVYVRAKMLPEKEIVAEQPKMEEAKPAIKPADDVFTRAQTKGGPKPAMRAQTEDAAVEEKPAKKIEETKAEPVPEKDIKKAVEEKAAVAPAAGLVPPPPNAKSPIAEKALQKKSYEQMLDEGASRAIPPTSPAAVEPEAGNPDALDKQSSLMGAPAAGSKLEIVQIPEEVRIDSRTNKSVMPVNQMRSPMRDVYDRDYEAEKSLEEIYSNPF